MCKSFSVQVGDHLHTIQRLYVINLDRQADRWSEIQRELEGVCDGSKTPLIQLTKRFSAIDADYSSNVPSGSEIQTSYSLNDQLFVEPDPALATQQVNIDRPIEMTQQEIAVALSHIAVWRLIASSDPFYTLVLEDDVYFRRNFARMIDRAWTELAHFSRPSNTFDILYLSYREAKNKAAKHLLSEHLFRPIRGLWYLSGYVLSKSGAKKLLELLPVRGPVDLWINHQFETLGVFATSKSVIDQRPDFRSGNLYSALPILTSVGVLNNEKPNLFRARKLKKPVFASGRQGTGVTSLAMALSMLGYRCCSDVKALPKSEHENLLCKKKGLIFDAYANVGSLEGRYIELARLYPKAKFVFTVNDDEELLELTQEFAVEREREGRRPSDNYRRFLASRLLICELRKLPVNVLILSAQGRDKWKVLCEFLECDSPTSRYPTSADLPKRRLSSKELQNRRNRRSELLAGTKLKFDSSPWIAVSAKRWQGIPLDEVENDFSRGHRSITVSERFGELDHARWILLDDTFPGNLALFRATNFSILDGEGAVLNLRKEHLYVRDYTSASICSRGSFLFGRFEAMIKPAKGAGLVTGVFLHRNSPRQEIDIEFLGKDTTKLLVNVFYNPGEDGATFEYGYRGTPTLINLGFDASKHFHRYAIEWSATSIRWFVDGQLAHERLHWEPTPIPHLPMQFYVNLWPSRSKELAGRFSDYGLPAHSEIRSIDLQVWPSF